MAYVSARYAPLSILPEGFDPPPQMVIATTDSEPSQECYLTEDSQEGDWLRYIEAGGTIDPAEEPLEPQQPNEPSLPERDYGAEIDALDARVTALENAAKT